MKVTALNVYAPFDGYLILTPMPAFQAPAPVAGSSAGQKRKPDVGHDDEEHPTKKAQSSSEEGTGVQYWAVQWCVFRRDWLTQR